MYRGIVALLLLVCLLPQTTSGQDAIAWEQECASGVYTAEETTAPAVMITCYQEDTEPAPSVENQLVNPAFSGKHGGTVVDGWDNIGDGQGNQYVISCCKNETSTSDAIKWGPKEKHGDGEPGVSGFIQQVVPARGRNLEAGVTALQVRASVANLNIYGRAYGGEWVLVWRPVTIEDVPSDSHNWHTVRRAITLDVIYDEYLVEFEARWEEADSSLGVKYGDAFFSSG